MSKSDNANQIDITAERIMSEVRVILRAEPQPVVRRVIALMARIVAEHLATEQGERREV